MHISATSLQALLQERTTALSLALGGEQGLKPLISMFRHLLFPDCREQDVRQLLAQHATASLVARTLLPQGNLQDNSIFHTLEQALQRQGVDVDAFLQPAAEGLQQVLAQDPEQAAQLGALLLMPETPLPLPTYFKGLLQGICKKHLHSLPLDHQHFLYPSYSVPAFRPEADDQAAICCYDLGMYYWAICASGAKEVVFANSLAFYDFHSTGGTPKEMFQDDNDVHLQALNHRKIHVVMGTAREMLQASRYVHPALLRDTRRHFPEGLSRLPLSYWLQWASKRLEGSGVLVLRGEIDLAKDPAHMGWRMAARKRCRAIYVQADPRSQQVLYFFVFSPERKHAGVFFSRSFFEDFAPLPPENLDWCTPMGGDFGQYLPLYSEQEPAVFQACSQGIPLQRRGWLLDLDPAHLGKKVQALCRITQEQLQAKDGKVLPSVRKALTFRKEQLQPITLRPFLRKWIYLDERLSPEAFEEAARWQTSSDNPALAVMSSTQGFSAMATEAYTAADFFGHQGHGCLLPLWRKEGRKTVCNVSDWAVERFRAHYGPALQQAAQTGMDIQALDKLRTEAELLHRLCERLPVLHKYSIQLQELLGQEQPSSGSLLKTLEQLERKVAQLAKGAHERRTFFESVQHYTDALQTLVRKADQQRLQAQEKLAQLTAERIFYYTLAVLQHPEYAQRYTKELQATMPRLPLLPDFWRWADWGEQLCQWQLRRQLPQTEPLQISEGVEAAIGLKLRPQEACIHLGKGVSVSGLDASLWDTQLMGQELLPTFVQELRERRPLDRQLLRYFRPQAAETQWQEVLRMLQWMHGCQQAARQGQPDELFPLQAPTVQLKKRKPS